MACAVLQCLGDVKGELVVPAPQCRASHHLYSGPSALAHRNAGTATAVMCKCTRTQHAVQSTSGKYGTSPAIVGASLNVVDPYVALPVNSTKVKQHLLACPLLRD